MPVIEGLALAAIYPVGIATIWGSWIFSRQLMKFDQEVTHFFYEHCRRYHSGYQGLHIDGCDCPEMRKVIWLKSRIEKIYKRIFVRDFFELDISIDDSAEAIFMGVMWPIFFVIGGMKKYVGPAIRKLFGLTLGYSIKRLLGIHKQPEIDEEEMQYRKHCFQAKQEVDQLTKEEAEIA